MRMHDSHQLRLSYLKQRMDQLPRCKYGIHNGRKVINIFYDPSDKTVSKQRKKRYYTDSRNGILYSKLHAEYIKVEAEYLQLLNEWKQLYKNEPEDIPFPLKRNKKPLLTSDFFKSAIPNSNDLPNKSPVIYGNNIFRSKNELIAFQTLENMGYECKPEVKITVNHTFCPDIIFLAHEVDRSIAVELDGAVDRSNYQNKALIRQAKYLEDGFTEFKDIIFFRLADPSRFDVDLFRKMVEIAVEMNAAEIINCRNRQSKSAFSAIDSNIPGLHSENRESGFYL